MPEMQTLLTKCEKESIRRIQDSERIRFDILVREAGLDPEFDLRFCDFRYVDFRGADLRGFDFCGADLRFSFRDDNTHIDHTTNFTGAKLDWIEKQDADLIQRMLEAESASNSKSRRAALTSLVENHDSVRHINEYLFRSIRNSKSLERTIDFADFLIGEISEDRKSEFFERFAILATRKRGKLRSRKKRNITTDFATEILFERLEASESQVLKDIYEKLIDYKSKQLEDNDFSKYGITTNLADLAHAAKLALTHPSSAPK